MNKDAYLRKLHFRAHHRGTREADAIIGGYFDAAHQDWDDQDFAWFERILEEQDVDIMGWALGTIPIPAQYAGRMMERMLLMDFVKLPEGLKHKS
jgi:antitoxin CptB